LNGNGANASRTRAAASGSRSIAAPRQRFGPIDGLRAARIECATALAFVQREGAGPDERSDGDRDRQRVDAGGDQPMPAHAATTTLLTTATRR
jgi:hypothetical protein